MAVQAAQVARLAHRRVTDSVTTEAVLGLDTAHVRIFSGELAADTVSEIDSLHISNGESVNYSRCKRIGEYMFSKKG